MKGSFFSLLILSLTLACSTPGAESAASLVWVNQDQAALQPRWYSPGQDGFKVTGYLPAYRLRSLETDQLTHLTDLVYFAVSPREGGDFGRPTEAHLAWLRAQRRDFGLSLHLGIAEHPKRGQRSVFGSLSSDPEQRRLFTRRLTEFLLAEGFQGADLDWEYPRTEREKQGFFLLVNDLRRAFDQNGLRLSLAVSPWHPLQAGTYEAAHEIHLMTYDDVGRHATLAGTRRHAEAFVARTGAPSKTLLGLPFYARGYTAQGPRWSQSLMYRSLFERFSPEPGQDSAGGFYYNGPETIAEKVRYARQAGLGGVMIWEIGQDLSGQASLLRAVTRARAEALKAPWALARRPGPNPSFGPRFAALSGTDPVQMPSPALQ